MKLLRLSLLFLILPDCRAFDAGEVDRVLASVQACRAQSNPALAVSVVRDGHVLLSRGYGVTALGHGAQRVTASTQFNIASLTKAFTATLMLKVMEEDRRFDLSTKVRDIMGDGFEFGDEERTREATVEDVLSHRMAIPANNRLRFNNNLTRANLKDRIKHLETPDAFRSIYIYSNLMYGLATNMTEFIGKARWETLVRRHLFRPLEMDRSTFVVDAITARSPHFAKPYKDYFGESKPVSPNLPYYWSELAGSGAVVSTADDMAKWMNFHLSKGQGPGGRQVMKESTLEELYKSRIVMGKTPMGRFQQPEVPVSFTYQNYSMGFRRGFYRDFPIVGHGGSSFGYRSLLTLVPSRRLGVFTVMTGGDTDYRTRGTLHAYLLDEALHQPPWLTSATICSFPAPWHNVSRKAWPPYDVRRDLDFPASAYVGLYRNPAYGTFEVRPWQPPGEDGAEEGQEPRAPFTLFYGYASWDLVPLPESSASSSASASSAPSSSASSSSSSSSRRSYPGQAFYGKGRLITAWVDYSPFVFHTPPQGSALVMAMSAPGLERRSPPVFERVVPPTSGGARVVSVSSSFVVGAVVVVVVVAVGAGVGVGAGGGGAEAWV